MELFIMLAALMYCFPAAISTHVQSLQSTYFTVSDASHYIIQNSKNDEINDNKFSQQNNQLHPLHSKLKRKINQEYPLANTAKWYNYKMKDSSGKDSKSLIYLHLIQNDNRIKWFISVRGQESSEIVFHLQYSAETDNLYSLPTQWTTLKRDNPQLIACFNNRCVSKIKQLAETMDLLRQQQNETSIKFRNLSVQSNETQNQLIAQLASVTNKFEKCMKLLNETKRTKQQRITELISTTANTSSLLITNCNLQMDFDSNASNPYNIWIISFMCGLSALFGACATSILFVIFECIRNRNKTNSLKSVDDNIRSVLNHQIHETSNNNQAHNTASSKSQIKVVDYKDNGFKESMKNSIVVQDNVMDNIMDDIENTEQLQMKHI